MSSSLMSCVRENSPPLDNVDGANCSTSSATGPMSLPDCHTMSNNSKHHQQQQQQQLTSTPLSVPNINECSSSSGGGGGVCGSGGGCAGGGGDGTTQTAEPKRRRFHPLRNLRRIFRRRTITNVPSDTPPNSNTANTLPPPTSSTSEKNLRSATLSSISSVVSASSPSSPLTHQQLQDAYSSQSLPKSKSYSISGGGKAAQHRDALLATVLGGKHKQQHQQQQQQQQQLEEVNVPDSDMYTTHASHTASSMYHHHHPHQHHQHHHQTHQQVGSSGGVLFQPAHSVRQSLGVAVLPSAMNRSFYAERQKLRSMGDSSQELDSSGNDSGSANNTTMSGSGSGSGSGGGGNANGGVRSANGGEISDSQRSLSEGRLVDSDYSHDPLSQSHDSVFSESASASLFSNRDYQAELSDVLRKRNRNRQDASEEDLGLPRSPASPQRRVEHAQRAYHTTTSGNNNYVNATATSSSATTTGGNQSEVSSLSLLSMNSGDGDEVMFATSTANNSTVSTKEFVQERAVVMSTSLGARSLTRSSTVSTTSVTSEIYRHSSSGSLGGDSTRDEPDLLGAKCQRLSHSAAKHKMALRPAKKKGPSRMHRRTLDTSIPEANEEGLRLATNTLLDIKEHDLKAKTRSLPPSVTTKVLDQLAVESQKTTSPTKSAKTKSTTSTNEQIIHVKRSKIDKLEKSSESGGKSTINSSPATTTTAANNSSSISAATSLFGLRTLTAKATALFEPPQESSTDPTPSEQELKREKEREKLKEKETSSTTGVESSESGFLRRLIQRNSKRSGARSNTAGNSKQPTDVVKSNASESVVDAKSKVQISTSCLDMKQTPESSLTKLDKSRSAMSYEQNIEETRKDIKREIMSVGSTGLNAMLNTHKLTTQSEQSIKTAVTASPLPSLTTTTSPQKPKSGAAARQRYLPQDIGSLDRKVAVTTSSSTTTTASESYTSSTSSILSKCSQQEIFQSTSIIREITASQASSVNSVCSMSKSTEHHFEKKPKIVGLSAFQQKISRSNDSVGRFAGSNGSLSANSTSSLDAADDVRAQNSQEQKQRKIVEKSRSFRTYQEDAYNNMNPTVHNNMPSLPDLTLNLRVPCYNEFTKDYSVAEARDLATTPRATESTGNLTVNNYNFTKNITVKGTPNKLTSLSSAANSCATPELKTAHEPTSSSDLLAKSPFINVLRKPTSSTSLEEKSVVLTVNAASNTRKSVEQINTTKAAPVSLIAVVPPQMPDLIKVEPQQQPLRPKVLHLRDSNTSIDTSTSTDDLRLTPTTAAVVSLREKPAKPKPSATVGNARNSMDVLAAAKDVERKSAPAPMAQTNKTQCTKTTKRSTSLMDSTSPAKSPNGSEERSGVSKQIEPTSGSSSPNGDAVPEFMRIQLNRVDPARIAKSANVVLAKNVREMHTPNQQPPKVQQERSPHQEKPSLVKSLQPQLTKEANISERNTNLDELNLRRLSNESVEIVEKSSPTEVDKQKPIFELQPKSNSAKSPTKAHIAVSALPPRSPVKKQQSAVAHTPTTPITDAEDSVLLRAKKVDATTPDASTLSSNKLSLQERKRLFMSEEKLKTDKRLEELRNERKKSITEEVYRKSFAKSEEKLDTGEKTPTEGVVMLRKKSFCATTQASAATNGKRDDPTPELMKVFARRSLKIKDEDINALADKLHASNGGGSGGGSGGVGSAKKFTATQQNVDSDKENQSASDEKLDKLPKLEAPLELQTHGGGKLTNGMNNRNSLADFRSNKTAVSNNGCANGLSLNNGNFNNNNHNNNSNNNNHTAAINSNSNNSNTSTTVTNTTANNTTNTTNPTAISTSVTPGTNGALGVNVGGNRSSFLPTIKVAGFRNLPIERNNSVSKIYPTTACEAIHNNNNNNNNNNNSSNNNLNNNHHPLGGHSHHQPTSQQQQQQQQLNGKTHERQSLNMKALESNNSNSSGGSSSSVLSSNSSRGGGGGGGCCKTIERSATVSEFKGIHQRRAEWEQRAKEALK